jgi:adenylosuccinate lyase
VPDDSAELFCPLEFRYGRSSVRALFERESRLRRALRVEAALAKAQAQLGVIPPEAADAIARAATPEEVTLARVDELERELRHDVMAITRALGERSGSGGAWVHFGATSADITDTALALELKDALAVLRTDLTELAQAFVELARRHRATPEVGRTHGQHAVPMTFGYKMAVAAAEVIRHRARLDELAPRLLVGKMAGAIGTGAGFGAHAVEIEAEVMRELGLGVDEAPTQIVGRDRLAEFTSFLALVAGTCERLATEVRNLQRTEIAEIAEPFDESRQVGSSTMAQKRNPMLSENVSSLARLVRAFSIVPLENQVLWHERDLANSANERIVVPHAIVLTDDMLVKLVGVFRGLRVDAGRMQQHLAASGGSVMSENLVLALTAKGMPRAEAHELLRTLGRTDGADDWGARVTADPRIREHFSQRELTELTQVQSYVDAAARKTDRILSRLEPVLRL